jgi:hypothetical protein
MSVLVNVCCMHYVECGSCNKKPRWLGLFRRGCSEAVGVHCAEREGAARPPPPSPRVPPPPPSRVDVHVYHHTVSEPKPREDS